MLLIRPAEKQYDAEDPKTNTNDQRAKYKTTIDVWGHWSPQELLRELKIHKYRANTNTNTTSGDIGHLSRSVVVVVER